MESGVKERRVVKMPEKSRNAIISKSSTVVMLNKHIRSVTPIKVTNVQRGGHNEPSLTPREKALMKQNIELKKENAEIMRLLKKSKELIKDEITKCKAENQIMRRFLEAAWPVTEGKVEEKLRDQVKALIGIKANTAPTNHSERVSDSQSAEKELEDLESLRKSMYKKEEQYNALRGRVEELGKENAAIKKYVEYSAVSDWKKEKKLGRRLVEGVLPVDSENVGSEGEEDEENCEIGVVALVPGFMKSLTLKE